MIAAPPGGEPEPAPVHDEQAKRQAEQSSESIAQTKAKKAKTKYVCHIHFGLQCSHFFELSSYNLGVKFKNQPSSLLKPVTPFYCGTFCLGKMRRRCPC